MCIDYHLLWGLRYLTGTYFGLFGAGSVLWVNVIRYKANLFFCAREPSSFNSRVRALSLDNKTAGSVGFRFARKRGAPKRWE